MKNIFRKYLNKILWDNKPLTHSMLINEFVDLDGKRYYSFEGLSIPIDRIAQAENYKIWLNNGLTKENLSFFLDESDKALNDSLLKDKFFAKNMAKISTINAELRDRMNYVIPSELIFNLLAIQFVREDEDPTVFNNQIQLEKVIMFKELEKKNNNSFFLNTKVLKTLSASLNMSEEKWREYLTNSLTKEEMYHEKVMNILSRNILNQKTETIKS